MWISVSTILSAQTCCSAGAPMASFLEVSRVDSKASFLQLQYEYNSVNRLIDNQVILENDPRRRSGNSLSLKYDMILNNHWGFSVVLPFVQQRRSTFSESQQASGLGDVMLLSQYNHPMAKSAYYNILAGIKLPTGAKLLNDDRGIVLSPDMQSGTGTFDFVARGGIGSDLWFRNLVGSLGASYRWNGTNPHFGDPERLEGRSFKFGNEWVMSAIIQYTAFVGQTFLVPDLVIDWRNTAPNVEEGQQSFNSGGSWLNATTGVSILLKEKYKLRVYGQLPLYQNLEGLQITTNFRAGFQIQYQLSSQSPQIQTILNQ